MEPDSRRRAFRVLGCGAGCLSCGCLPIVLAVVGLWMTAVSPPLMLTASKFVHCRDAVRAEVRNAGTSRGPMTAGSSTAHTFRYYDLVCTYADGRTKVVPNDAYVIGGFQGGAIGGAVIGFGIGVLIWLTLTWLTGRRRRRSNPG